MFTRFSSAAAPPREAAIVFVHGFTGDCRGTWRDIPALLLQQPALAGWDIAGFGYDTTRSIDIRNIWSSNASLEEIATMLESSPDVNGYRRIAFVAHSMGGLVVQRAIVKSAPLRKKVSHAVFLGTPSAGLAKAGFFAALKQQVRDMNAAGPFIRQLRADWTAGGLDAPPFHLLATAGEKDQFVPPVSSIYPFAEERRAVIPGDHLSMLRTDGDAEAPVIKLLRGILTHGAAESGPRNSAALAIEEGKFQDAIDRLWPLRAGLDNAGASLLALALDARGRRDEAIEVLRARGESNTDALGVLAGRYKRRWLLNQQQSDFDNSLALYQKGFDISTAAEAYDSGQAFYHGVNLAYLKLATQRLSESQTLAAETLRHCAEFAKVGVKDSFWRLATQGDACAILGQKDKALAEHKLAAQQDMNPWQALSIEEQAVRIADLLGWSGAEQDQLSSLYLPRKNARAAVV